MQIRELTQDEFILWDGFVKNHSFGSFLQTSFWARLKKKYGWDPVIIGIFEDRNLIGGTSILFKKTPIISRTLCYAPGGPVLDWDKELSTSSPSAGRLFRLLISKINVICQERKAIFWRPDFLVPKNIFDTHVLIMNGFVPSFEEIQPIHTLWLDLTPDDETILKIMKEKGRYNINLAKKKGVSVVQSDDIKTFYFLHKESAKRDHFLAHSFQYFKDLYSLIKENNAGKLFIGSYNGEPLSAMIVFNIGKMATNVYSGSSAKHKEVMANYLTQWETILFAKKNGCTLYDFHGLAPAEDDSHKLTALRQYKTRFGGFEVDFVGPYDYIYDRFLFSLYKLARRFKLLR